jgi:hypothetical protein
VINDNPKQELIEIAILKTTGRDINLAGTIIYKLFLSDFIRYVTLNNETIDSTFIVDETTNLPVISCFLRVFSDQQYEIKLVLKDNLIKPQDNMGLFFMPSPIRHEFLWCTIICFITLILYKKILQYTRNMYNSNKERERLLLIIKKLCLRKSAVSFELKKSQSLLKQTINNACMMNESLHFIKLGLFQKIYAIKRNAIILTTDKKPTSNGPSYLTNVKEILTLSHNILEFNFDNDLTEVTDICEIIMKVKAYANIYASEKNITLHCDIKSKPTCIHTFPRTVLIIIGSFLLKSIDTSPKNDEISISLDTHISENYNQVHISIKDNAFNTSLSTLNNKSKHNIPFFTSAANNIVKLIKAVDGTYNVCSGKKRGNEIKLVFNELKKKTAKKESNVAYIY